jgi:hypothetical protein
MVASGKAVVDVPYDDLAVLTAQVAIGARNPKPVQDTD